MAGTYLDLPVVEMSELNLQPFDHKQNNPSR
jgi:hypothetical protein